MINVGVIGTGHMGEYHVAILKYLHNNQKVNFVGICDINAKRLEQVSKKYEVKAFNNADELLEKIDAVNIAVWTSKHYEVTKNALLHNVNVLVEKPFAHLYGLADEVANLAKKKNLVLQVGHVERFNGAVVELRKKYIKNPIYFEAKRFSPKSDKVRDTGVILDLMVHDIDIILNLNNSKLIFVNGFAKKIYTEYEDFATALLGFEDGSFATITSSRASFVKQRALEISQKSNFIKLNYDTQEIEIYRKSSTLFEVDQREIIYHRGSFIEKIAVYVENALRDEIVHFINCVEGKEKPLVENENDLFVLKTTLQVIKKAGEKNNFKYEVDV